MTRSMLLLRLIPLSITTCFAWCVFIFCGCMWTGSHCCELLLCIPRLPCIGEARGCVTFCGVLIGWTTSHMTLWYECWLGNTKTAHSWHSPFPAWTCLFGIANSFAINAIRYSLMCKVRGRGSMHIVLWNICHTYCNIYINIYIQIYIYIYICIYMHA